MATLNIADGKEDEFTIQQFSPKLDEKKLEIVGKEYYKLHSVTEECQLSVFTATIQGLTTKCKLGYGFYQFTKPEFILNDKQVILMGKVFLNLIVKEELPIRFMCFFRMTSYTMAPVLVM